MIPDFKTFISESIWSDMQDRGTGDTVKKEDDFNPEYVDFGPNTTVYWAQDALELNGETEFNFEDVENYNSNGWRLPTVKEVEQVDFAKRDKRISWYREDDGIGYTHLKFNEGTLKIKEKDIYATSHLTLWTKDRHEKWKHDAYVYGFHSNKFDIYPSSFSINKHYVFLVKDKKPVNESIWSDMQERGTGDAVKREDDVNHMNFDTFADYIKDNYSEKGDWFSVDESLDGKSRHIYIDIISGIDLNFNVVDGKIYNILISNYGYKYIDVPGLKKIFNVNILGNSTFSVVEKDWTKSNNTFVKLIKFFLEKKTNESIWSDMQDRGTGDTVKKEDDIESLDIYGLHELIVNKYELKPNYRSVCILLRQTSPENKYISLPVFATTGTTIFKMIIMFKDKTIKSINIQLNDTVCRKWCPSLFDKFLIVENATGNGIFIYSKAKEQITNRLCQEQVTNRLCMDVIETIVNDSERSVLQKREN